MRPLPPRLEQFQFETLCVSNHTACRCAEKTRLFRLTRTGRHCAAAHFTFSKLKRSHAETPDIRKPVIPRRAADRARPAGPQFSAVQKRLLSLSPEAQPSRTLPRQEQHPAGGASPCLSITGPGAMRHIYCCKSIFLYQKSFHIIAQAFRRSACGTAAPLKKERGRDPLSRRQRPRAVHRQQRRGFPFP